MTTMAKTIYLLHSNLQRLHSLPALDIMDNQVILLLSMYQLREFETQNFYEPEVKIIRCAYEYFTI